jgi:hypothetical protein
MIVTGDNRFLSVIAGLDPAIHPLSQESMQSEMDARVKPAHDGGGFAP